MNDMEKIYHSRTNISNDVLLLMSKNSAQLDLNSVICYHTLIYYSLKSAAKIRKIPHTIVIWRILL